MTLGKLSFSFKFSWKLNWPWLCDTHPTSFGLHLAQLAELAVDAGMWRQSTTNNFARCVSAVSIDPSRSDEILSGEFCNMLAGLGALVWEENERHQSRFEPLWHRRARV